MAVIGNSPATTGTTVSAQSFNGDNSTVAFTLTRSVNSTVDLEVLVDNVQQSPYDSSYSVSGTTLTFSEAPATGTNNIYVIYRGATIATAQVIPDDGSVSTAKLQDTAITSAKLATGVVEGAMTTQFGRRNLIINGAMQVAQRGTSDTVDGGGWDYVIDRFCALGQSSAGVFTYSQDSDAPAGFQNSLKVAVTTADSSLASGDIYTIRHTIEGYNSAHLDFGSSDAKTVTLSFWVKSSLTGTFGGALNSEGNNRSYAFTYSISAANTWEYKTITISGDTTGTWGVTNSHGVRITWGLGVGTTYSGTAGSWAGSEYFSATGAVSVIGTDSATWQITGVQLEVGTVATPFEHRSYGEELTLCQRYYYNSHEDGDFSDYNGQQMVTAAGSSAFGNTVTVIGGREFPVTMRASATVTLYHQDGTADAVYIVHTGGKVTGVDAYFATKKGFLYGYKTNAFNQGYAYYYGYTAEAEL